MASILEARTSAQRAESPLFTSQVKDRAEQINMSLDDAFAALTRLNDRLFGADPTAESARASPPRANGVTWEITDSLSTLADKAGELSALCARLENRI